ncbi:MAG TPA: ATP-grasp domain-containing protein [Pirellulales bacterium]|jgi:D-alanine-D-alanine ligase|nr:ATP-grasp domain-containing protein [Pirellulales bacterium]
MRVGLTFNLRSDGPSAAAPGHLQTDDAEEEFDSPETIEAIAAVLRSLGHEVDLLGDGERLLRKLLDGPRPDWVFNFAEGTGIGRAREARVPAVLEMFQIPYSGSDPLTLAVTLDKECAKRLVRDAEVPTPAWLLVDDEAIAPSQRSATMARLAELPLPVIVKPAFEGSSKGVFSANLIHDRAELLERVVALKHDYQQPILVEEFIDGDELTVGLIGNPPDVFGIMQVVPVKSSATPFVYSLEVKRDWQQQVRYHCPAPLSAADTVAVRRTAVAAWRALGCRDVARIDFRLRGGVPYFLEVNPLPGLNPKSSDLVLMAHAQNISHAALIERIARAATRRIFGP